MTQKNETKILILALLLTAALVGIVIGLFKNQILAGFSSKNDTSDSSRIGAKNSLGDAILVTADTTPQKQAGVEAFNKGDFTEAAQDFQSSLKEQPNDPETLIYLNNAQSTQKKPLKIAVVVPVGGTLNVAKEILRGVAQSQNEINQKGGINGRGLQVLIVNDDNNSDTAKQVANALVKDSSILAVVGHNSSDATLAAAPIYEQGKLVMVSPTAKADKISELGDYIFRTVFPYRFEADILARYGVKTAQKRKTLLCYDSQDEASQSLKEDFTVAVSLEGGKLASVNCDFAASDFNPNAIISQAISNGTDSLLLIPAIERLTFALDMAKANQQKLSLLGSSTIYTFQILKEGQANVKGMVLTIPWHPHAFPGNPFAKQAKKLWGGEVNWRSASAYDATQVIIAGLEQGGISREEVQQALSQPEFAPNGTTGKVTFLPSGDRVGTPILVKIEPDIQAETGFNFVPIQP